MSSLSRHQKIKQSLAQGYSISKISIPSYHVSGSVDEKSGAVADDVVVYEVDVSNKKLRWNLWLRFEFFYVLHQMMQELVAELATADTPIQLPPFPEKRFKFLVDHFDPHFIENRRMLLDNYLNKILQNQTLRHSEIFIQFLTPPENEELESLANKENKTKTEINENVSANASDNVNNSNDNNTDNTGNIDNVDNNGNVANNEAVSNNAGNEMNGSENDNNNSNNSNNNNNNDNNGSKTIANETDEKDEANDNVDASDALDALDTEEYDVEKRKQAEMEMIGVDENDEVTGVYISQGQVLKQDHTIYQIHVFNMNKRESFSEWTVLKRYGDFHTFDDQLRECIINDFPDQLKLVPPCPPRYIKVFTDHLDPVFIEKRRLLLQSYLQRLIKYPMFRRHELTMRFLGVDS